MSVKFNPLTGNFDLVGESVDFQDQIDALDGRLDTVESTLPNKINTTEKGAANGVAPLNSSSKIDAAYLPSFVDDVEEYADLISFPLVGEASKIYVALDTNRTYRWSGSTYVEISPSEVISVNTKTGVVVLDKTDIGLSNVDNTSDANKPISTATQLALDDISNRVTPLEDNNEILKIHAYEDNQLVWGSAQPPLKDPLVNVLNQELERDGWYYQNQAGEQIAWYFFDGSTQATIQQQDFSCYTVITLDVLTSKPIFGVYSFPTGTGDVLPGFAHSRWSYQISTANLATMTAGKKYLLYVGENPAAHPEVEHIPLTFAAGASGGDLLGTELVYTSALISDPTEPIGEVRWMVESLGVWSPNYKHELALRFKKADKSELTSHIENLSNPHQVTKTQVGLSNVDNTSDANKPISTATQDALDLKYDASNPAGYVDYTEAAEAAPVQSVAGKTGDVLLDKNDVGLNNVDNTSDANKPVSTATQTALDLKVNKAGDTMTGALGWSYDSSGPGFSDTGTISIQGTGITAQYSYSESDGTPPDPDFAQGGTTIVDGFGVVNSSNEQGENRDAIMGYTGFFHAKVVGPVRTPIMPTEDYQLVPKAYVDQEVSSASGNITEVFTDTKEPTGFIDRTESVLAFNDVSREFSITPVGASFSFYLKGTKYTKEVAQTVTIPDSDGNHYIYFDASGNLASTQVFSIDIIEQFAFVSVIYWNTTTTNHTYFAEERHGITMDGVSHAYLHTVFGARYLSGLALQNFSIDGDGSLDAHSQFTADSGSIRDEDLLLAIPAQLQIPILYRIGQHWRKKLADAYPLIYSDGSVYTGATIPFNEFTGGAWQLTPVDNNKFVLVHLFACNDTENGIIGIQGINQYGDIPSARVAANSEISSLSGLPFTEFVPIGTVIFQTGAFTNTANAVIRSVDGADYVDFRGTQLYTPAGEATSHGLLSGLSNDDHIQYHTDARGDARYNLKSSGDIAETSFSITNNQSLASNVVNFAFSNTVVRGFTAIATVEIDATNDLYENFTLNGIQKNSEWNMSVESVGDNSGIVFSITSTGQIQYTSTDVSGFVTGIIKFRALTTSF